MSWKSAKLTAICNPKQWKIISQNELYKSGYPVYGANGKMGFFNEYNHEEPVLLIGCRGTCGSIHISEPKSYTNGNAMACDNLDSTVNIKYLKYFFEFRGFKDIVSGGVQPQITIQNLSRVEIPLPPLSTQKRIAEILDAADALRRKDQELLNKYDELAQAIFIDMFGDPVKNEKGWEVKELGDLFSEPVKCGPFGSALKKEEYIKEGIPVWIMDNIQNYDFNENGCLFINEEKYGDLKSYSATNGDIIISRAGTVGKMSVINSKYDKSIISTNLIKISLNESRINPYYFVKLMQLFGKKIGRLRTGSDNGFTHMNTGVLAGLTIPLPPIEKQRLYIQELSNIKSQSQLLKLKPAELFESLLQQAFKGELVK
jgi:type I restriction enzyme S subunit